MDYLLEMYQDKIEYGIVMVSGKEFRIYVSSKHGSYVSHKIYCKETITLQKHQKKGGQSALRFSRTRDEKEQVYIRKILEKMVSVYEEHKIDHLIVAGCAGMKDLLVKESMFQQYFQKILLKCLVTNEISDATIHQIYNDNTELFLTKQETLERKYQDIINKLMIADSDKLLFGVKEIHNGINECSIKEIVMSDTYLDDIIIKNYECTKIIIKDTKLSDLMAIKYY